MKSLTHVVSQDTQLQYEVVTAPFPLQASPSDETQPLTSAAINIVVSNPSSAAVGVESIAFHFDIAPAGDPNDATYLTSVGTGITLQVLGASQPPAWTITNGADGTFTAVATAGSVSVLDQGIAFVISGIAPNRSVGTFTFAIRETLQGGPTGQMQVSLSKFPYSFFLTDFAPDAPTVPNGGKPTLRWQASTGATLTILWSGGTANVSTQSSWQPQQGLTEATTFLLQASVGTLALASVSTSVQVIQPTLDLTSLTVEGASSLKGDTTVGGQLEVTGPLNADFNVALSNRKAFLRQDGCVFGSTMMIGALYPNRYTAVIGDGTSAIAAVMMGSLHAGTVDTGPTPAIQCGSGSSSSPVINATNNATDSPGNNNTGIYAYVSNPDDFGLATNASIANGSGVVTITHIKTSAGHRVVTSPMTREIEIHLHGEAKLAKGRARIDFDSEALDMITASASYRVLVTAAGICDGLCVTERDARGFTVREAGRGRSKTAFDWFVIARKRAQVGAEAAHALPAALPAPPPPVKTREELFAD